MSGERVVSISRVPFDENEETGEVIHVGINPHTEIVVYDTAVDMSGAFDITVEGATRIREGQGDHAITVYVTNETHQSALHVTDDGRIVFEYNPKLEPEDPLLFDRRLLPFGALVRDIRDELGLTQRDVAAKCDRSIPFVSRVEGGNNAGKKRDTVNLIIKGLGLKNEDPRVALLQESFEKHRQRRKRSR